MAEINHDRAVLSRRTVLAGVGAVGAAGTLVACGSTASSGLSGSPATSGGGGGAAAGGSVKSSDIPVGGGKVYDGFVVTQPTAGTFKAFSSTCTHQGCQVNAVSDGLIKCPCHGSEYSITDGSVKSGPAPAPLPAKTVTVAGGQITVA